MITQKSHPFKFKNDAIQTMFESWLEVFYKQPVYQEISSTVCKCGQCEWIRQRNHPAHAKTK